MPKADWIKIKNEYINTDISQRKLAEKYKVSFPTLRDRAKKEDWKYEKDAQRDKIVTETSQKTAEKIVEQEVDRIARIYRTSDLLHDKVIESINQLVIDEGGIIDIHNLRKLVATLKDLRDIVDDSSSDNKNGMLEQLIEGLKNGK